MCNTSKLICTILVETRICVIHVVSARISGYVRAYLDSSKSCRSFERSCLVLESMHFILVGIVGNLFF